MKTSGYVDYILELLEPLSVSAKAMFGGYGLYSKGLIFAIIADEQLYFKVGPANQSQYEKLGSKPFLYESRGKQIKMSYWEVPSEIIDDQDALCTWAETSYKVALISKKVSKK